MERQDDSSFMVKQRNENKLDNGNTDKIRAPYTTYNTTPVEAKKMRQQLQNHLVIQVLKLSFFCAYSFHLFCRFYKK